MKKISFILAALIGSMLMLSATAGAKPKQSVTAKQAAKQECRAEKRADKKAFKATYGKRAMRTCIKGEKEEAREEISVAKQECRDEREADRDGFGETYGSNNKAKGKGKGRNAFGKCVASKVKSEKREDVGEFKNAANECRAEREADRDAFKEQYGSNKNGKNAFGKCVASKVAEAEEDGEGEGTTTS